MNLNHNLIISYGFYLSLMLCLEDRKILKLGQSRSDRTLNSSDNQQLDML